MTYSPLLLPEKSATIKNIDNRYPIVVRIISDTNEKNITIYPGQRINYTNADTYVRTTKSVKIRIAIYPENGTIPNVSSINGCQCDDLPYATEADILALFNK